MSARPSVAGDTWRRRTAVTAFVAGLAIALVAPACASDSAAQRRTAAVAADPGPLTFPRTGTYYLAQHDAPTVDELARYDVVVIDAEWGHRLPRSFFDELRVRNPRMTLLAYVNPVDKMPRTGSPDYWSNAYSLWQFTDSTHDTFPREWLAYTAAGQPVHEWPNHIMTNLTDEAPKVDGRNYAEYVGNWVVDTIWSTGLWDGIFLDVWGDRIYGADSDHWDIDGDGIDEPADEIYGPDGPLARGLTEAESIMRQRMPDAVLVVNGDRTPSVQKLDGTPSVPDLDGLAYENFADVAVDPERDVREEIAKYVDRTTSDGFRQPGTELTINQRRGVVRNTPNDYRKARFLLTASLLQNGYWAPMGETYGLFAYYDELDGGGLGRGYLGRPLEGSPTVEMLTESRGDGTGSPAQDVFRRDFEHGIALVNTSGEPRRIVLERPYRHLTGTQDPNTNNGATVSEVTIPAGDGVILLRVEE
ncbi:putative glycoside hydrolase [Aldersonia kunmingensis]|uniref:putative glycoside hydrolase n=1 Tax=Aldersonia kunmingensis TaxID=408066 RepID=UPI001FDFDB0F|nr:putative glycoside hydrolase [Aldersonia kunmingensis]